MGSEPLACLTEYPALSAQPEKPWAVVSCIHMSVVSLPSPLRYASLVAKVAVGASLLVLFSAPGPPDSRWADCGDGRPIAHARCSWPGGTGFVWSRVSRSPRSAGPEASGTVATCPQNVP